MPEISRFYGIVVQVYYGDHLPAHFHVEYAGAVNFFLRLVLVAAVMIFWQVPVDGSLLFFPVAIGLALTPIAGLYGDIGRGIPIIAQFWMLLTPLITTARECLTAQPLTLLPAFWIVTVCAAIAAFLGLVLFRLAIMPHLIARMGG